MTSGLETEWDYSGRNGRDGQKKKIGKATEKRKKGKSKKRAKDEEVPRAHSELVCLCSTCLTASLLLTLFKLYNWYGLSSTEYKNTITQLFAVEHTKYAVIHAVIQILRCP